LFNLLKHFHIFSIRPK